MEMTARWTGTCKASGRVIVPGTLIEYSKASGARHVTPEACAAAPQTLVLRGPQPESPDDRARATRLLLAHPWTFARTSAGS